MKKIFKYMPIVLGLVMVMSSCGDDEGDGTTPAVATPTLSISVNGTSNETTYNVVQGAEINIAITGQKADKDLDVIKVVQNGINAITTGVGFTFSSTSNTYNLENNIAVSIKNADDETLLIRDTLFNITSNVGITTYTFSLTDNAGLVATKAIDISVTAAATPFTVTDTASIWHIEGMLQGSYNLNTDANVSKSMSSSNADIRNTDMAGATFTGSFKVGDLRTTSDFVKADAGFDFATATATSAQAAYDAIGTKSRVAANPAANDVYLFNVNGTITAVQVMSIDPNNTAGGTGNPGKMTFVYKK